MCLFGWFVLGDFFFFLIPVKGLPDQIRSVQRTLKPQGLSKIAVTSCAITERTRMSVAWCVYCGNTLALQSETAHWEDKSACSRGCSRMTSTAQRCRTKVTISTLACLLLEVRYLFLPHRAAALPLIQGTRPLSVQHLLRKDLFHIMVQLMQSD